MFLLMESEHKCCVPISGLQFLKQQDCFPHVLSSRQTELKHISIWISTARHQWLMPIILVFWEAEVRRIAI
jgi:hypothetical protein